jgi:hypothetical protein
MGEGMGYRQLMEQLKILKRPGLLLSSTWERPLRVEDL